jgi:surface carbohydrate biosynthesis protein (TIGR04326 family)
MRDEVIVLHPEDAGKARRATAGRSFSWLYLGQDTARRENIARVMGGGRRHFLGDVLLETAGEQKQPFLDFLTGLGREQPNRRYWWASELSYRNPLTSDFFQLWCYAALFERIYTETQDGHQLLVVFVEDRWLYRHLWQRYRTGATGLKFLSRKWLWPEAFELSARFIAYRLYFLQRVIRHLFQLIKRASHAGQAGSRVEKDGRQVYIHSWIQERFFTGNGEFQDTFFGRLPAILSGKEIQPTYLAHLFLPASLKNKCLASGRFDFSFLDDYLRPGDLLTCFFAFFRINIGRESEHMKTLLRRQALREIFLHNHLTYYFAYKRWLEESNGERITIIYPFENQPSEKMLCLAAVECGKDIRLIAYQHTTMPAFLLNYFAGSGESDNMPLPEFIVADGTGTLATLEKAGFGTTKLVNGGALRYEYLHHAGDNRPRKGAGKPKAILVALPYMVGLTQEMLLATFHAFAETSTIEVLIKYHPAINAERLGIKLPPWPAHFRVTKQNVTELLQEIDAVVCWSSTMVLEMFLTGVPVIRYRSENNIGLDSLEEMNETGVKSCHENDMREVILSVMNETDLPAPASGRVIDRFFSRVNEEVWLKVVQC